MNFVVIAKKKSLLAEINFHLGEIPASELNFEVKGSQVTLKNLRITQLKMSASVIDAMLAVEILVDKDTLLTKVTAEGEIEIEGKLNYSISPEWMANSSFQYIQHRWLENPDVNIGLIQFSVKTLIDSIIEKQKENIETKINSQLKSFSDLSIYLNKILPFINQLIHFQQTSLHVLPNIQEIIIEDIEDSDTEIKMKCTLMTDSVIILCSDEKEQAKLPSFLIRQIS